IPLEEPAYGARRRSGSGRRHRALVRRRDERLEGRRLPDRIAPAEQRFRTPADGVREVLKLELVRVGRLEADLLLSLVPREHDPGRRPAMPGMVEEDFARAALQLELMSLEHVEAR